MQSKPKKSYVRSFVENFSLVVTLNIISMAVTFLGVAVLVRLLGVNELGLLLYAKLLSTNGIWQIFDPGIRMRMSRAISMASIEGNYRNVKSVFIAGIQSILAISIVATVIFILSKKSVLSVMLDEPSDLERFAPIYWIAISLWLIEFPGIVIIGFLEGLRKFGIVKIIDLCQGILSNIIIIFLAFQGYGFEVLAFSYLTVSLIRFIILLMITFSFIKIKPMEMFVINKGAWKILFSNSKHFLALTSLGQIYAQIEKIAFVVFLSPSWMVALEIVSKMPQAIRSITDNTRPVLINLSSGMIKSSQILKQWEFMKITAQINLVVCAGISTFVAIEGYSIIELWVGSIYSNLVPYIWLNLLYNILLPPYGALRDFLIAQDQGMKMLFRYSLIQTTIRFIILALLFAIGIPLAFGICLLLGLLVTVPLFRYVKLKMNLLNDGFVKILFRTYLSISIAAIGPLIFNFIPNITSLTKLIVGGLLYILMLILGLYITGTIKELSKINKIS